MNLPAVVSINNRTATAPGFTVVEYKQPPRDHTLVKVEVTRACWVTLRDGGPMQAVKPGQVLQLPRWLANDLAGNGKASLL